MKSLFSFLYVSLFVLRTSCVQFEIPEVAKIVGEVLDRYQGYIHSNGSSNSTANAIPANADMSTILPRATAYWYEDITHQGISAFGPSGYTVYRNVKDYGATGTSSLCEGDRF